MKSRFLYRSVPLVRPASILLLAAFALCALPAAPAQTQAPKPVISPTSGYFASSQSVTVTDSLSGVTIYYTIDGSIPTVSSPVYHGAFNISSTTTVRAIAAKSGYTNSPVAFSLLSSGTQSTAAALTLTGSNPYTMSCSASGNVIAGVPGPTGTVTFSDITEGATLATVSLATPTQSTGFKLTSSTTLITQEGATPTAVPGDFNGDGIPDLVLIGLTPEFLAGIGDGTFQAPVTLSSNIAPSLSAIAADFNGDGKLDLAVLESDGNLVIFLGNGDGTFQATGSVVAGTLPGLTNGSIYTGFFNQDSVPDLAVIVGTVQYPYIQPYIGVGDGTFTAGTPLAPQTYFGGNVVVGSFHDNGRDDILIDYSEDGSASGSVMIYSSNADGTFQSPVAFQLVNYGFSQWLPGDFNNDGHLDLAIEQDQNETGDLISIIAGNGDGTFQYGNNPTVSGSNFGNLSEGYFDGTGNLGLVAFGEGAYLFVVNGNADGTLQAPAQYNTPGLVLGNLTSPDNPILDLNGDGYTDFVTLGTSPLITKTPSESVQATLSNVGTATATGSDTNVLVDPGTVASHTIQCSYSGDANYAASTASQTVTLAQLSEPVFSLRVGQFTTPQTVTVSSSNPGATLYYTTDGSNPSTGSTLYTAPFAITTTTTVKAIAVESGYLTSAISEAVYTFASAPSFSPPPGSFASAQSVTVSDSTTASSIYYTLDGSAPTPLSTPYTAPVTVPPNATLKAMAIANNYLNSSATSGVYKAPLQSTQTVLKASAASINLAQSVTLTATVTGISPTGTVTFLANGSPLGKAAISSGVAKYQATFAAAKTYSITAQYSGDQSNTVSTSTALSIIVNPQPSATALTASASSIGTNQPVTLSATVTGASPTGSVKFLANGSALGTANLSGGTATYQPTFAKAGTYSITAQYSGDQDNAISTSSAVSITVIAPDFSLISGAGSQTVSAGSTAAYKLTIAPANGYNGTLAFSCTGLPSEASCSFDPASLTFSSSASQTSKLTITTTAPTTALAMPPSSSRPLRAPLALAGLLGLLFGLSRMRRLGARLRLIATLSLLALVPALVTGCGGGGGGNSGGGGGGGGGNAGTPAGTYTVTIHADDSANNLHKTLTVTLVVQ